METDRKAQNPVGARQTIADRPADPEPRKTTDVSERNGWREMPSARPTTDEPALQHRPVFGRKSLSAAVGTMQQVRRDLRAASAPQPTGYRAKRRSVEFIILLVNNAHEALLGKKFRFENPQFAC
jgi:hypothetical protein